MPVLLWHFQFQAFGADIRNTNHCQLIDVDFVEFMVWPCFGWFGLGWQFGKRVSGIDFGISKDRSLFQKQPPSSLLTKNGTSLAVRCSSISLLSLVAEGL
jgi:hypothetical protein